ncbi:MAG: hypothetical protein WCZ87_00310 [Thiohalobacteraceae bacterium]
MAYATVADVQALLRSASGAGVTIGPDSVPTQDDVENWLDQVSAEIDGVLHAQGYETVPATGARDVQVLKRYTAEKSAAITWHAHYGAVPSDHIPARVKRWEEDYRDFLARLRRGEQHLNDQSPEGESDPIFGVAPPVARDDYFTAR